MEFHKSEIVMLLFTAIGPLKVTIVCASLTAGSSPEYLRRVAFRSVLVALIVCLVFAVVGEAILKLMKVSIPAFQMGGGIIVLLFALDMVMGGKPSDKDEQHHSAKPDNEGSLDIAVYPLAIPLMASVSGLVAIVSLLAQRDDLATLLFLAGAVVAIMALNYVCLVNCKHIVAVLGPAVLQVVSKLLGVIMVALAVELFLMGLIGLGLIAKPAGTSSPPSTSALTKAKKIDESHDGSSSRRVTNPFGEGGLNLPIRRNVIGLTEYRSSSMRSMLMERPCARQTRKARSRPNFLPFPTPATRDTDASFASV